MRVKFFWKTKPGNPSAELESEINVWLQQNPKIKISDIRQSGNSGSFWFAASLAISVWYEEAADP
jgi:hypothetical protein